MLWWLLAPWLLLHESHESLALRNNNWLEAQSPAAAIRDSCLYATPLVPLLTTTFYIPRSSYPYLP